jgi:membrane-associated phospholipid phosphatase
MRILTLARAANRAAAFAAVGVLVGTTSLPLAAQQSPAPTVSQQGRPAGGDTAFVAVPQPTLRSRPPVFTRRDLGLLLALGTTAAALLPADARIARELRGPGPQSSGFLRGAADGAELLGSPGALVVGGSFYAVGIVARQRSLADIGWHTLEALILSGQTTNLLKGVFGRARPYAADGDARDFDWGSGFGDSDRRSFPSGHTSMAFTLASVLAEETSHRWPRAHRFVAPVAYATATSVGLARMYHDKHWASDVALGAAIGTLSGRLIVRWAHGRPRNWIDRVVLWRE